jgi:hypothetical protein
MVYAPMSLKYIQSPTASSGSMKSWIIMSRASHVGR